MLPRELVDVLKELGFITDKIRNLYFNKMTTTQIRHWLMLYGLDSTMPIESPKAPDTLERLKNFLQHQGVVTKLVQEKWFNGWNFGEIRNWLEEHDLDRHMYLELDSTEVVLKDPDYLILQQRKTETTADGRKMCGFFGGVIQKGEMPLECARRELAEETGIHFELSDEENLMETNTHCHKYDSGDKALFYTHRYVVETFIDTSDMVMDQTEAVCPVKLYGVDDTVLLHQREFANLVLMCESVKEIKRAIAKRVGTL